VHQGFSCEVPSIQQGYNVILLLKYYEIINISKFNFNFMSYPQPQDEIMCFVLVLISVMLYT